MPLDPATRRQILATHAEFIRQAAEACRGALPREEVEALMVHAEEAGWGRLVAAVRGMLSGRRDPGVLAGLDEEDAVIAGAILEGIEHPERLPDPTPPGDPTQAAPGLARMIHQAARGDTQALQMLGHMGEQMTRAGGDMARLAGCLHALIHGERDAEQLARGMSPRGRGLLLALVEHLARLDRH